MKYLLCAGIVCFLMLSAGCGPKQGYVSRGLQTFTPVMIDMEKIENKDYSELIATANENYSPGAKEYVDARIYKEEGMFMYFRIYSGASTACVRVTVDKNRRRILNMQPDCAIEE